MDGRTARRPPVISSSFPVVTALAAAALALIQVVLALMVVAVRFGKRISLGDGGDAGLNVRVRRHGNLTESAALFVAMLLMAELSGDWESALPALAATFVICSLAHPFGLTGRPGLNLARAIGTAGTHALLATAATLLAISASRRLVGG
jgi:uncharacterized membrane protein YecN with MAPEG domain